MTNSKKELRKRWLEPRGKAVLEGLSDLFFSAQYSGEHLVTPDRIEVLLEEMSASGEVSGYRDLRGITMNGGVSGVDFGQFDFSFAVLNFNFVNCDLTNACFDGATIRGSLSKTLDSASFRHADLRGCFVAGCSARDCNFDNSNLGSTSFEGTDLRGSNFSNSSCTLTKFFGSNLIRCDFHGAYLRETPFQNVLLDETTDFRGAQLVDIFDQELRDKFGNIIGRRTDWRRAKTDETTAYIRNT
jgi:uncharacterized protein YjbI with pentapeptide repeats